MRPHFLESIRFDDFIGLVAIVFGVVGVVLPAIALSFVRRVMREQEHLGGMALGGAIAICVVGLLAGATVLLATIGWLPSPREFLP